MKKIIISCLALIMFISALGNTFLLGNQSKQESFTDEVIKSRNEIINNSDFIFEGVIIKSSYYIRSNAAICSDIVKITKVFRGKLITGTVEIENYVDLDIVSNTGRDEYDASQLKKNRRDTIGIFFCRLAREFSFDPKYNLDVVDNKPILTSYYNNINNESPFPGGRILSTGYGYLGMSGLKTGRITTKAELYQILRKYPNLKIPDFAEPEPVDSANLYVPKPTYGNNLKAYLDSMHRTRNNNDSLKKK